MKEKPSEAWQFVKIAGYVGAIVAGIVLGANLFPRTEQVIVERIVERRVEVPVDRIIERTVVKWPEAPVRAEVRANATTGLSGGQKWKDWSSVRVGMSRQEVFALLGHPDEPSVDLGYAGGCCLNWGGGIVVFDPLNSGGRANYVSPP